MTRGHSMLLSVFRNSRLQVTTASKTFIPSPFQPCICTVAGAFGPNVSLRSARLSQNSYNSPSRPLQSHFHRGLATSRASKRPSFWQRITSFLHRCFTTTIPKSIMQAVGGSVDDSTKTAYPDVRRLIALLFMQKRMLIASLTMVFVGAMLALATPALAGTLIDFFVDSFRQSKHDAQNTLYGMSFHSIVGLLFSLFVIGAAMKAGSNIMLELAGIRMVKDMRKSMYSNALRQEVEWADSGAADALSRLSLDANVVGEAVTSDIGPGLRAGVTVVFSSIAMLCLSPHLAFITLAIVPPTAIAAVVYGQKIRELTNKTQDAVGSMTTRAENRLRSPAFQTIAACNTQTIEADHFSNDVQQIVEVQQKVAYASGIFFAGCGLAGNSSMLGLLLYGGSMVADTTITLGELTAFLMYAAHLGSALANLAWFFASLMRGIGASVRIFALMDRQASINLDVGSKNLPTQGTIQFDQVTFTYPSRPEQKVLDNLSLRIEPGECVALVGESGSGKSSVHKLLLRFYDPTQGRIYYANENVQSFRPDLLREHIGIVPQMPTLFDGTVADNIAYGLPGTAREKIEDVAHQASCWEFIKQLPRGFDTYIGAQQLSGGQQQRIAIARALLRKPTILLLDEATSALDATSEQEVNRAIQQIIRHGKMTVLIVAHRLSTVKTANRIVVLERGKIVEDGSYDELAEKRGRFHNLMALL